MALTHMASDLHATLFLPIYSTSNSGFLVITLNFFNKLSLSAKACLSYSFNLSKKPISIITFFAPYQSLFSPNKIHTPYKTITTAGGGFAKPLISVISFLLSFFNASAAALRAGIAFANYVWASSVINLISCCYPFTNYACYWTTASTLDAYWVSVASCFKNYYVFMDCSASCGLRIVISFCSLMTTSLVAYNFYNPNDNFRLIFSI